MKSSIPQILPEEYCANCRHRKSEHHKFWNDGRKECLQRDGCIKFVPDVNRRFFVAKIKEYNNKIEYFNHYIPLSESKLMIISWDDERWNYKIVNLEKKK